MNSINFPSTTSILIYFLSTNLLVFPIPILSFLIYVSKEEMPHFTSKTDSPIYVEDLIPLPLLLGPCLIEDTPFLLDSALFFLALEHTYSFPLKYMFLDHMFLSGHNPCSVIHFIIQVLKRTNYTYFLYFLTYHSFLNPQR